MKVARLGESVNQQTVKIAATISWQLRGAVLGYRSPMASETPGRSMYGDRLRINDTMKTLRSDFVPSQPWLSNPRRLIHLCNSELPFSQLQIRFRNTLKRTEWSYKRHAAQTPQIPIKIAILPSRNFPIASRAVDMRMTPSLPTCLRHLLSNCASANGTVRSKG